VRTEAGRIRPTHPKIFSVKVPSARPLDANWSSQISPKHRPEEESQGPRQSAGLVVAKVIQNVHFNEGVEGGKKTDKV
jgi:hypothetical protein